MLKRLTGFILALIILCSPILPVITAKADSFYADFHYESVERYVAEYLLGRIDDIGRSDFNSQSHYAIAIGHQYTYTTVAEALIDQPKLVVYSEWYDRVGDAFSAEYKEAFTVDEYQKGYYETVLLDYLCYSIYNDEEIDNELDLRSLDIENNVQTALLELSKETGVTDLLSLTPTDELYSIVTEQLNNAIGLESVDLGLLLDAYSTYLNTVEDVAKFLKKYAALNTAIDTRIDMLKSMKIYASDNAPFIMAVDEIIYELECINSIRSSETVHQLIVDKSELKTIIQDNLIFGLVDHVLGNLIPSLAYIKAGKSLLDLCWHGDEIAENNITLLTYYIVRTYVYLAFIDAKNQYLNETTNAGAVYFNSMFMDYLSYESYATTFAKKKFSNSQLDSSYESDLSINKSIYSAINRHYELFPMFKNAYEQGRLPKGQCGGSLYWDFYDSTGVLRFFGSGNMYNYEYCSTPWSNYLSEIKVIQFCDDITGIGDGAFSGCTNLRNVTIPDTINHVGEYAFGGCSLLTAINVSSGNNYYVSVDGVLYTKDLQTLVAFPGGLTLFLPLCSVKKIANYAYYNCSEMTSVAISDNETEIGNYAYAGCKTLNNIPLSYSLKFIGEGAFLDCKNVTNFTIPSGVTVIRDNTFSGCTSLTSIQLPRNLAHIGNAAFKDCNELQDVYFLGSNKEWNEIAVGIDNEPLNNAVVHCAIGDEEAPAQMVGNNLVLDGEVGIYFYMELGDSVVNNKDAYMEFTKPNGIKERVLVSDAEINNTIAPGKSVYAFRCNVVAKEMSDDVNAQIIVPNPNDSSLAKSQVFTYSVKQYADYIISHAYNNEEYANALGLVLAMVNYGTYAQEYFGHSLDHPTTLAKLSVDEVTPESISQYAVSEKQGNGKIQFTAASLVFLSSTTLRLRFTTNNDSLANVTIMLDNDALDICFDGDYYYVDIVGISASELDDEINISVVDGSDSFDVYYTPMTYCYTVLSHETDETCTTELKKLIAAIVIYNREAEAYVCGKDV